MVRPILAEQFLAFSDELILIKEAGLFQRAGEWVAKKAPAALETVQMPMWKSEAKRVKKLFPEQYAEHMKQLRGRMTPKRYESVRKAVEDQPVPLLQRTAWGRGETKVAVGINKLKSLLGGDLSTNVMQRSSVKFPKPTVRMANPPPVGRVTTVGGSSIATQTPGVNIRPATAKDPKMPLIRQENLRAGPGHIAQSTPAVPQTIQGQPAKVSTPAPTGGTLGGASGGAAAPSQGAAQGTRTR